MNKRTNRLAFLAVVGALVICFAGVSGISLSQAAPQNSIYDDEEKERYHSHYRYSGNRAYAELEQVDEDTGIHTRVLVYATDSSVRGSDNHENSEAEIGIFQFTVEEVCQEFYGQIYCWNTFVPILEFYGETELEEIEFKASNSLRTASLATQVSGYDYATGEQKTVQVEAKWTGFGDVFRGKERYLEENNFYRYSETSTGASREATVAISVSGDFAMLIEGGSEQQDGEVYEQARIGKYMGGESEFERQS